MTEKNPDQNYSTLLYTSPAINLTIRDKRPPYNTITSLQDAHKPWVVLTGSTLITSLIPTDPTYPKHVNHILIEDMLGRPPGLRDGVMDRGREWVTLLSWLKFDQANKVFSRTMAKPFRTVHNGQSLDINIDGFHYFTLKRSQDIVEI
jgi:hypothetical protein